MSLLIGFSDMLQVMRDLIERDINYKLAFEALISRRWKPPLRSTPVWWNV